MPIPNHKETENKNKEKRPLRSSDLPYRTRCRRRTKRSFFIPAGPVNRIVM